MKESVENDLDERELESLELYCKAYSLTNKENVVEDDEFWMFHSLRCEADEIYRKLSFPFLKSKIRSNQVIASLLMLAKYTK